MKILTIKAAAAQAIRNIASDGHPHALVYVKLTVKPGGCYGFTYHMEAATEKDQEGMKVLQSAGIFVIVDDKTFASIVGLTIDYDGGFNGKGFIYDNPSATKCCHCGISFSTK